MRTIANPQKWNKYAYTLNNPLALIDPDGKEEVTIQFRAFIPQANVGGFRGDNRSFSSSPTASQERRKSVDRNAAGRCASHTQQHHDYPTIVLATCSLQCGALAECFDCELRVQLHEL